MNSPDFRGRSGIISEALSAAVRAWRSRYPDDGRATPEQVLAWHERLAREYEQAKQWYAAAFHLRRLVKADGKNEGHRNRLAVALYENGQLWDTAGRWEYAFKVYTEAIELNASNRSACLSGRGWSYHKLARDVEALADSTKAIEAAPGNARFRRYRGMIYLGMKKYDDAIGDFTESLRLDETDAATHSLRGTAYFCKHDLNTAILNHSEAIRRNPKYAQAYKYRSYIFRQQKKYAQAIKDCSEALLLVPNDPATLRQRAGCHQALNAHDQAVADLSEAIHLEPGNATNHWERGISYYWKALNDRALDDFEAALKIDPKNLTALNWCAFVHAIRGEFEKTLSDCDRSLAINATQSAMFLRRGLAYRELGKFDKALADFKESIRLDPKNVLAHIQRGCVAAETGKSKDAAEELAKALELASGNSAEASLALAHLHLLDEDRKEYRLLCAGLVERHKVSKVGIFLALSSQACVLMPDSVADFAPVVAMAERAVTQIKSAMQLTTLGAALHRAGKPALAIERLVEADALKDSATQARTWLYLALAYRAKGEKDEAHKWLEKATKWIDEALK